VYDIENSPSLGWVWQKFDTNVVELHQDWFLLCFAYKWLGESKTHYVSLPQFADAYKKDPKNDYHVVAALHALFDEADIVIAHNGNRFDQTKARARMLLHGFAPHTPFREIDTLKIARRHFNFTSNSLDDLCRQLGIGRKEYDGGIHTWLDCVNGDMKAWRRMEKYNRRDVKMLEELYNRLIPWIENAPNLALMSDKPDACPRCGEDEGFHSKGWRYYTVTKRRVFRCKANNCVVYGRVIEKSPVTHVS
jgi:hypothetical protein